MRCVLVLVTVVGCSGKSAPPRPSAPPVADAPIAIAPADAAGDPALGVEECRRFAAAGALAIATVANNTSDCSGVGHERIVFDVVRLVRGTNITKVVTSRSLAANEGPIVAGDTFLLAIEPVDRPAATVHCVPVPAHQGTVEHLVQVASIAAAEQALAACPANRP
jgi:hypothetical protein